MADFDTDLFSIRKIVYQAKSQDEAETVFNNMHGISLPKQTARMIFEEAVNQRFPKTALAGYLEGVEKKYRLPK